MTSLRPDKAHDQDRISLEKRCKTTCKSRSGKRDTLPEATRIDKSKFRQRLAAQGFAGKIYGKFADGGGGMLRSGGAERRS
jgi:hypothetical protein